MYLSLYACACVRLHGAVERTTVEKHVHPHERICMQTHADACRHTCADISIKIELTTHWLRAENLADPFVYPLVYISCACVYIRVSSCVSVCKDAWHCHTNYSREALASLLAHRHADTRICMQTPRITIQVTQMHYNSSADSKPITTVLSSIFNWCPYLMASTQIKLKLVNIYWGNLKRCSGWTISLKNVAIAVSLQLTLSPNITGLCQT